MVAQGRPIGCSPEKERVVGALGEGSAGGREGIGVGAVAEVGCGWRTSCAGLDGVAPIVALVDGEVML